MQNEFQILANTIKSRRRTLGMTQQELADHANCGITFINQLEKAKTSIRFDKLLEVMKVLGLGIKLASSKNLIATETT